MFSGVYDIEKGRYGQYGRYLHERHFWGTLVFAFLLHLGAVAIYSLLPADDITEVPVRVLNIKLGGLKLPEPVQNDGDGKSVPKDSSSVKQSSDSAEPLQPNARKAIPLKDVKFEREKEAVVKPKDAPKKPVTPAKPKPIAKVTPAKPQAAKPEPKDFPPDNTSRNMLRTLDPLPTTPPPAVDKYALTPPGEALPKRYTRESRTGNTSTAGSPIGNSEKESAEIRVRYTQTLSLWIDKNKVYPLEARQQGLGGQVILRIRINREGRILRFMLEQSSGHESIDRAISSMVDAANPVPPVPSNYPDRRPYLEFLIPINFKP